MKRIFELKRPWNPDIERKIIEGDTMTTQYVIDETTAEAEKRMGLKICSSLLEKTKGEVKGYVYKETKVDLKELGWNSIDEFIRERLQGYTEVKV